MVYVRPQEALEVTLDQMGSWKELADYLKFLFSLMMAYSGCVCVCVCVCVYSHAFSLETFQMDSIFPSFFSNELALYIMWPKYLSFSISPSSEYIHG